MYPDRGAKNRKFVKSNMMPRFWRKHIRRIVRVLRYSPEQVGGHVIGPESVVASHPVSWESLSTSAVAQVPLLWRVTDLNAPWVTGVGACASRKAVTAPPAAEP